MESPVKRTLNLRREVLVELTTRELAAVAGASGIPCDPTTLFPPRTGIIMSIDTPCTGQ
jgi:hypothetical protein